MYIVSPHPDGEALVAEYNQQAVDGLLQVAALPPLLQQTMHLDVTSQQVHPVEKIGSHCSLARNISHTHCG